MGFYLQLQQERICLFSEGVNRAPEKEVTEKRVQISGYRYYSPRLGRWINRDPSGEMGGKNILQFSDNSPINSTDFLGLWIISRTNKKRAEAISESGDTIKMFSNIIGLDSDHYGNWLGVKFGGIPKTEIEEINPGQTFLIPNTVIAAWGGNCGGMGKLYVSWDFNINYLNDLGFHVDEINYSGNKIEENSLGVFLEKSTKDKVVHGLYFWGHGNTTALYNAQNGKLLRNGNLKLAYKLAACFIFACESNSQKSMLSSGSPGSIWFGTPVGEIYKPYPNRVPEFLLESHIKYKEQGTRSFNPYEVISW